MPLFSATLEELPRMLDWVRAQLLAVAWPPRKAHRMELACEEIFVNIIRYAYPKKRRMKKPNEAEEPGRELELDFQWTPNRVKMVIADRGIPFNPLEEYASPDLTPPLEQRKPGGLGVFLARQCVDEIVYKREDEGNVLTLIQVL